MSQFVQRHTCPACNGNILESIYRLPYSAKVLREYLLDFYGDQNGTIDLNVLQNTDFSLLECKQCDFVFQEFIPDDEVMKILYSEWINSEYTRIRNNQFGLQYFKEIGLEIFSLVKYFKKPPHTLKFLDFGMGWAKWIMMAKSYGIQAYGIELAPDKIKKAKENGIKVIGMDALDQCQFDYIHTEQVFEHIPDPKNTLSVLVSALCPNGIIKISVPNGHDIRERLKVNDWQAKKGSEYSLNAVAPLEHINCFSRKTIIQMASRCNLKMIELDSYEILKMKPKTALKNLVHLLKNSITEKNKNHTSLYFMKLN